MVDWHRFTPSDFDYDFEQDKLAVHGVTFNEAVDCFFSDFEVRRNKKFKDRYQLIGEHEVAAVSRLSFNSRPKASYASSAVGLYDRNEPSHEEEAV